MRLLDEIFSFLGFKKDDVLEGHLRKHNQLNREQKDFVISGYVNKDFSDRPEEQLIQSGLKLWRCGRRAEALTYYDQAIQIAPDDSVTLLNRGNLHLELGNIEEALNDYESARRAHPKLPESVFSMQETLSLLSPEARELFINKRRSKAIREIRDRKLHPEIHAQNTAMTYGTACGTLKPLSEVNLPDMRLQFETIRSDTSAHPMELADLHERLSLSLVSAAVPERVRVQFEIAKNLMLYTWFVFEFQTIAELQAYSALEYALRERFQNPTRQISTKKGPKVIPLMLSELLTRALNEGLILPEKLASWEWVKANRAFYARDYDDPLQSFSASQWMEIMKIHIPDFRNHLAHGNPRLHLVILQPCNSDQALKSKL